MPTYKEALSVIHVPRRFTRTEWGGTETALLATARGLRGRGVDAGIWTSRALAAHDDEEMDGVPIRRFGYFYPYMGLTAAARGQLDRKGGNLFSFSLGWHLMRRPRLDLLHLHTGKRMGGIVRTVARLRGIPYVVTLHGGLLDIPAAEAATFTEPTRGALEWGRALGWCVGSRRVMDDAAAIVCVGAGEAARVRARWPGKRVLEMGNGVDAQAFATGDGAAFRAAHGIGAGERVVLCVARVDPQKNQLALVRALPGLARRDPAVRLVLIGPVTSPDYRERVEQAARDAGVAARLILVPGYPPGDRRLVDAYHAADVCVLPSVHEPFGIAILEAWAARRPVVATRVGGIPGFVRDGEDALLVPPGDDAALEAALADVLARPDLAASLAERGAQRAVREFDWERPVTAIEQLYRELVPEVAR